MRILIVDDDIPSVKLTAFILTQEGYDVRTAYTSQSVDKELVLSAPDLILLDVMLPEIGGFDVCRRIRHTSDVPIIFLSGYAEIEHRVAGLEVGGDDYLVKPFDPAELVARVKAVLRRHTPVMFASATRLNHGNLTLDPVTNTALLANGRVINLTPVECHLLACLMQNPNQVLETEYLLNAVWRYTQKIDTHVVATSIRRLRTKIEQDPARPRHIITVRKSGYIFEA